MDQMVHIITNFNCPLYRGCPYFRAGADPGEGGESGPLIINYE